eukprot:4175808-Alexandrium_andersonii.AAC.1
MGPPRKLPRQHHRVPRAPPPYNPPKIELWAASRQELKAGIEEKGWCFLPLRRIFCPGLLLCRGQALASKSECV